MGNLSVVVSAGKLFSNKQYLYYVSFKVLWIRNRDVFVENCHCRKFESFTCQCGNATSIPSPLIWFWGTEVLKLSVSPISVHPLLALLLSCTPFRNELFFSACSVDVFSKYSIVSQWILARAARIFTPFIFPSNAYLKCFQRISLFMEFEYLYGCPAVHASKNSSAQ